MQMSSAGLTFTVPVEAWEGKDPLGPNGHATQ